MGAECFKNEQFNVIESKETDSKNELRELAEQSYSKQQWEGAEALYRKMFEKGEQIEIVGPKIFTCILNAHSKLSESNIRKLNEILDLLESRNKTEIVSELRKQLDEKISPFKGK